MEQGVLPPESGRHFSDKEITELKKQYGKDSPICRLIARLEAAERLIAHSFKPIEWEDSSEYIAWRKSAGRG